jgi:hypothetical protein
MQRTQFTVVSCTPTKEGKFVWKLHVIHTGSAFGIIKTFKRTYYIGGMTGAVAIGHKIEEDIAKFDIVKRPVAVIIDANHTGSKTMDEAAAKAAGLPYKVVDLAWLHLKPSALVAA